MGGFLSFYVVNIWSRALILHPQDCLCRTQSSRGFNANRLWGPWGGGFVAHSAKAFWPNQSPRLLIRLTHARNKNRLNKADEATEDVEEIELTDQMKNSFFHLFKQPEEGSEEVSLMDRLNPMNAFQGPTKCPHCGESLIPKVTHPSNSSWSRFPSFLLTSSFF